MSKLYDFNRDFVWSEAQSAADKILLRKIMPPQTHIGKSDARLDKLGADYACVVLNFDEQRYPHVQAVYFVDIKRRRGGASQYWRRRADGTIVPELALELGTGGGLFKTPVITDALIYVFDESDYPFTIAVEFDELRRAAATNRKIWRQTYRTTPQRNQRDGRLYEAEVTFVPLDAVVAAGVRVAQIDLKGGELSCGKKIPR